MYEGLLLALVILFFGLIVLFVLFFLPGLALVRDSEVGIVTKKMFGTKLPKGQIIATKGEIGLQADTLMPGLYWRFPVIWRIQRFPVTRINPGSIGIVESIDGRPIATGRLLGDEVECSAFQDAKSFLEKGGCKGPQIAVLRPGTYRINTQVFRVKETAAIQVPKEMVGVVVAMDGIPLPSGYIIAPDPTGDHKHFQDGQTFINESGHRGPQLETLQPGEYYINPLLFEVNTYDVATVPPGYVAVVISSVGRELTRPAEAPKIALDAGLGQPVPEAVETLLITNKSERGILKDPVAPGKYNLNTIAYKPVIVPTSAITIDWASRDGVTETKVLSVAKSSKAESEIVTEFFKFNQLKVTSKDGFQLDVDVRLIIRIPPANAPFVIARFGTVSNLIEQVAHPLIDSSFRNEAGNKAAMEFVHSRTGLQTQALEKAREEFNKYHVEVQGLLIAYIKVDEKLLETQTRKEIAVQQQKQYEEEAKAQEQRIAVAEKTARADKQTDVIAAKLSIDIATDRAQAFRKEAEGIRDATKTKADGNAYEQEQVGKAIAAAYHAQTDVLGAERIAALKLVEEVARGNIVITPNILVNGSGDQGGNLFNALMAKWLINEKPGNGGKELAPKT
jgi:regulator of protease activity HflC (stomatin/prohibitin superfamily)